MSILSSKPTYTPHMKTSLRTQQRTRHKLPVLVLITALLSLPITSCKDATDESASSPEQQATSAHEGQTETRSSRVSRDRAAPVSAGERENNYKEAMRKAAMNHLQGDVDAKESFDQAMQEWLNDPVLFGERRYASADQVTDKKVVYHLPVKATQIQLLQEAAGHYAHYKISEEDFKTHMVMVWERYREEYVKGGGKKWIKHSDKDAEANLMGRNVDQVKYMEFEEIEEYSPANQKQKIHVVRVPQAIIDAGWQGLQNAQQYQGPIRTNGGTSTYYYDRDSGYAFQDVGYW